ncbi:L-aminoadipate-semialdehyde dehydrogenase large subunit [Diplodia seriata]|uniref:L-aminoadipate-semialdehyde dehydrogenase large subunit n=1 Tax=Diplodia seriata TaxID=420778 RepID=A0A1S8BGU7_9PEZI|nr:L-aminoadipate-semialdehyde dehydrogenase large subunit [Diplodia seriata]
MSATATVTTTAPPTATTVSAPSTIDELIRAQAARADDPVLVAYPATDVDDFEQYTAKRLNSYADAAAAKYASLGLAPADPTSAGDAPVVALLAPSSFDVIVTILAVSRLGWALLFLSPRLAAAAHARLLETCRCGIIIAAPGEQQDGVVPRIRAALASTSSSSLTSIAPITRADYRTPSTTTTTTTIPRASSPSPSPAEKTAWIIHSSGSTGFPKPIPLSHRALLANFAKGLGLRAFCASPLFHSHGLMELFRCVYRGVAMWSANHARAVTAANLVRAMRAARPELVTAVPYVLGLMAEREEGVEELRKARVVMFAGAACPEGVGDALVAGGVNLVANYGSSETGAIMSSLRPPGDTAWSYLRLPALIAPHILMDEISPGVYECVALSSLPSRGAPSNSDTPPDSFRTRDLFAAHPTQPGWWRYLARLDDRLALTNGEKVLPLPIEGAVRQCRHVAEAVVFGAGRAVPGMLVFRAGEEGEGGAEMGEEEGFVEAIWGHVEGANAGAESFARIPRELVVAMPAGTEWPRTDKGTAVRQRVYDVFADVIEAAYARFERTGLGDREEERGGGPPLLALEVAGLEEWLLEKFRGELGAARLQSAEADVFAAGVDSLQTMRMWSLIRKTLDLGLRRDELGQNVVYEKGNVKTLARHLYALRTGEAMGQSDEDELLAMQELVDEFSAFDPHVPGDLPAPDGEVVVSSPCPPLHHPISLTPKLLTGATGGLGAHILHTLLTRPPSNLTHIYALARAPSASTAHSRILSSLRSRGLTLPPPPDPTTPLWTALPYTSLSLPDLSLPPAALATLRARLTCVVHAAWPVNFALPVRAFRPHVAGLHALLDRLCLRVRTPEPAALWFASSVAAAGGLASLAAQNGDDDDDGEVVRAPEAVPRPFATAQGMGYGRSKLVGEKIVAAAGQQQNGGMRARVLRIGQLVGDLGGAGDWNGTEAVPLLVRGVWETGVLPALDENMSWLPIDVAAASILDIALPVRGRDSGGVRDVVEDDAATVYHILNPQTFAKEKLRDSDPDVQRNPSRKLLGFWEGKYGQEVTGKKTLGFQTEKTLEMAPRLGEVPMADILRDDEWLGRVVRRWVSSW